MKTKDVVNNPHDRFFKRVLSDKDVARQVIASYLPKALIAHVDLRTLSLMSPSFIDHQLEKRETDLLYQINIDNKKGYFYFLLEHQSTPDIKMPLRTARYVSLIQERHMDQYKTDRIPLVYPIVFYNGKARYPYPTDIHEMIEAPDELLCNYRLARFHLVDLNDIEDSVLRTQTWSGLSLYAMKHSYDRDLIGVIDVVVRSLEQLYNITPESDYLSRQIALFCYIMSSYGCLDKEAFMQTLQQSRAEAIRNEGLTLAEQFRMEGEVRGEARGEARGLKAGRRDVIQRLLNAGMTADQINQLTQLPLAEIQSVERVTEE